MSRVSVDLLALVERLEPYRANGLEAPPEAVGAILDTLADLGRRSEQTEAALLSILIGCAP